MWCRIQGVCCGIAIGCFIAEVCVVLLTNKYEKIIQALKGQK